MLAKCRGNSAGHTHSLYPTELDSGGQAWIEGKCKSREHCGLREWASSGDLLSSMMYGESHCLVSYGRDLMS